MVQLSLDEFIDNGKWDCKVCGCTYDPIIEVKTKTETCSMCRYILKIENLKK